MPISETPIFFARRYDEAIRQHRAGRDLDPGFSHISIWEWRSPEGADRLGAHRMPRTLTSDGDFGLGGLGYVLGRAGKHAEAMEVLRKLEDEARGGAAVSFDVGSSRSGLGTGPGRSNGWGDLSGIAFGDQGSGSRPEARSLRKEPGFEELLRRTRLDQEPNVVPRPESQEAEPVVVQAGLRPGPAESMKRRARSNATFDLR